MGPVGQMDMQVVGEQVEVMAAMVTTDMTEISDSGSLMRGYGFDGGISLLG